MKKIVIIHSIYNPDTRGGAETAVENIVSGLKTQGHDVYVISVGRKNILSVIPRSDWKERRGDLVEVKDIRSYKIKPFNLFNFLDINSKPAWLRLPWHIIDMFNDFQTLRIYKVLKNDMPDIALTHNLKGLGYYIPWLLKIMKIKQVHTVHDMQLLHPSGLLKKRPLIFYSFVCKKLFGSPETVIFPSEYIKGIYDKYGFFKDSERVVIANPVVILRGAVKIDEIATLPKVARNDSFLNILFLGQVEEYKGILDLINAVKEIKGNLLLHIVGDGKALEKAKKIADQSKQIKFYGHLSQEELEKIWFTSPKPTGEGGPNIDLLVNPSKVPESFGMVIVEAFSHSVPVIVSNNGALPELVCEGETGFIFEDNLKEKIKWCVDNKDKLTEMRKNCLREAKQYEIDEYLNKLNEFAKII